MYMKVTRRDFIKGSLAGAAALTLTGLGVGGNVQTPRLHRDTGLLGSPIVSERALS